MSIAGKLLTRMTSISESKKKPIVESIKVDLPELPGIQKADWIEVDGFEENGPFLEDQWKVIEKELGKKVIFTTSEDSSDYKAFSETLKNLAKGAVKLTTNNQNWEGKAFSTNINGVKAIIGTQSVVDIILLANKG